MLVGSHAFEARGQAAATPDEKPVASKFDEFDMVGGCDHSARLDNLAITLMNEPTLEAHFIIYGPEGDGSGSGNFRLDVTRDYLVNTRGVDVSRLRMTYAGRYKSQRLSATQIWIVPRGADAPEPEKYENEVATFKGKFAEYDAWDGIDGGVDGGTGPPIGDVGIAGFSDMLRQQPETHAYVVVYHGDDSTPGLWRRVAERYAARFEREGIEAKRVRTIFGGYQKEAKAQFWILPKDAPPPVADAGRERKVEQAVRLGEFNVYQLGDEKDAAWAYKAFADLLREDADLRACIIVRLKTSGVVSHHSAEEQESAEPDDLPKADLVRLVYRWGEDLSQSYGIGAERFIIMFTAVQDEWSEGQLETWLVPQGAELPDPFPVKEEASMEEEVEQVEEENPKEP
ncbi:MAG TPA: hypothetical protein VGB73_12775 [Pyrinomonadaceae bacterium]